MTRRRLVAVGVMVTAPLFTGGPAAFGQGGEAEWFRGGAITPRSEAWGSYEILLNHPDMRAAFAELGFEPDSTARHASHEDLGNALFLALQGADPGERDWFLRADELLVWATLRGDCLHLRFGLPDTLSLPERADLECILRTVIPGVPKLEFPACTGGSEK